MIKVTALYPNEPGKRFEIDYFMNKHMPMVHQRLDPMGLVRSEVEKGIGSMEPGAPAPFVLIANLIFNSMEELHDAFTEHTAEMMGDMPNFTDIQPQFQIGEIL